MLPSLLLALPLIAPQMEPPPPASVAAPSAATARPPDTTRDAPLLVVPVPTPRTEHSLAAEFGVLTILTASYSPSAWAAALTLRVRWAASVEAALGMRLALGDLLPAGARAEGFASVALAPSLGAWRPAVGLELGVTGIDHLHVSEQDAAPGHDRRVRLALGPVYAAVTAEPLRFAIGRSFALGFVGLHFGTDLERPGRTLRVVLSFARVEVRF